MGSTGHGSPTAGATGYIDNNTYGVVGVTRFKGAVPENSGLKKVGANNVVLKAKGTGNTSVLFQFYLSKDNKLMTIKGYRNGVPEVKCVVDVDSKSPSIDRVIAKGTKTEKMQATKLKSLMRQSTEVSENQLSSIANSLLQNKTMNRK